MFVVTLSFSVPVVDESWRKRYESNEINERFLMIRQN